MSKITGFRLKGQPKPPMKISDMVRAMSRSRPEKLNVAVTMPVLAPGVVPESAKSDPDYLAMDAASTNVCNFANIYSPCQGFLGYPLLSELTIRSEYRAPVETTANEMTRRWIRICAHGDGNVDEKIKHIEEEFKRHRVCEIFRRAAIHDGFFGRGQVFINIKGTSDDRRKTPLIVDPATIREGSLLGFKNIEPIWTTPYAYNSIDPTTPDFFKPTQWFVLGKQTHASRLLNFIGREVPDMLKPAFNFGGMSLTQLMIPYVDSWLRTRDSISEMVHSYSILGFSTDMSASLSGSADTALFDRIDLFNQTRDNRNAMILNKDSEEFFQFAVPLSGLHELQSQAQEQMAAPSHTPLIKLLGITPSGLNASSDGEIAVYYDFIRTQQELLFADNIHKVLQIIQLDQFGEIDPDIGFEFEPMQEMDGEALARVRKSDADAAMVYIQSGVLSVEEERGRLASDPNSGYNSLDVEDMPEMPDSENSNADSES